MSNVIVFPVEKAVSAYAFEGAFHWTEEAAYKKFKKQVRSLLKKQKDLSEEDMYEYDEDDGEMEDIFHIFKVYFKMDKKDFTTIEGKVKKILDSFSGCDESKVGIFLRKNDLRQYPSKNKAAL